MAAESTKALYVGCTFREFTGSDNDRLQHAFLESIRRQSDGRAHLVVTCFGEKQVEAVAKSYLGDDRCTVFHEEKPDGRRYSHTRVLNNAIRMAIANRSPWAWSTVDVRWPTDMVSHLMTYLNAGGPVAATAHPNILTNGSALKLDARGGGFDLFAAHAEPAVMEAVLEDILAYPNTEWGALEYFLTAVFFHHRFEGRNVRHVGPIIKTENDRVLVGEAPEWIRQSMRRNELMTEKYILERHLPFKFMELAGCDTFFPSVVEESVDRAPFGWRYVAPVRTWLRKMRGLRRLKSRKIG